MLDVYGVVSQQQHCASFLTVARKRGRFEDIYGVCSDALLSTFRKAKNPFHIYLSGWNSQQVLSKVLNNYKHVLLLGPVLQTVHCFTVVDDGQ